PVARILNPTLAVDDELVFETPGSWNDDLCEPKTGLISFEWRGDVAPSVKVPGNRNAVCAIVMKDKHQTAILDSRWFASHNVQRVVFSSCEFHSTSGVYNSIALPNHGLRHNTISCGKQNVFDCAWR